MKDTLDELTAPSAGGNQVSLRQGLNNIHSVAYWPIKENCFIGEDTCRNEALRLFKSFRSNSIGTNDYR